MLIRPIVCSIIEADTIDKNTKCKRELEFEKNRSDLVAMCVSVRQTIMEYPNSAIYTIDKIIEKLYKY